MPKNKYTIQAETKGFKQAEQKTKKLGGGMKSLAKSVGGVALAYFSAQGLISGLKAVIQLSAEQELAEKKLSTAFRGNIKGLKSYASQLQQTTRFGDEMIMGVMTSISAFNRNEDEVKRLTKATLDLAEGTGMDLKSAGDLVAKSIGSSTNALSRYGIEVTGAVGSSERLDTMLGNISEKFEGQASASADTMSGSIAQMNNALGDMGETIGNTIAPVVINLAGYFKNLAEDVGDFFTKATETSLETSIRQLQEMGVSTLQLQKISVQKEVDIGKKSVDRLQTESQLMQDQKNSQMALKTLLMEKAKIEADYLARGIDLDDERMKAQLGISSGMDRQSDALNEYYANAKANSDVLLEPIRALEQQIQTQTNLGEQASKDLEVWRAFNLSKEELLAIEQLITEEKDKQAGILSPTAPPIGGNDEESLEEKQAKSQAIIDAIDVIEQGGHAQALQRIAEQKEAYEDLGVSSVIIKEWETDQVKNLERIKRASQLETVSSALGGLGQLAGAFKKGAKVQGRIAQTQAIIDTWAGANKALASAPPPFNYIAMAGVIATGFANVANISSQIGDNFHTGGLIGGGDNVPINAQGGEFVMQRSAVESIGIDRLTEMNEGGGGGLTINVSSPLIDDTIIETIIPEIERAYKEGLA